MNGLPKQTCKSCRYYHRLLVGELGECRRYPPTIDQLGKGKWPEVKPDDWCGEFNLSENALHLDQTAMRLALEDQFASPRD
jgi:hypothetical protein